jgi:hypothetical protein
VNSQLNRLFGSIVLAGCGAGFACQGAFAAAPDDAGRVFTPTLIASVGPDVLAHATGNYGVNLVSGFGNRQGNVIVASAGATASAAAGGTTGGTPADNGNPASTHMSITTVQSSGAGRAGAGTPALRVAVASLGAGALAGSVGNIGVNIAAGYGNLQQNTLISR